MAIRVEYAPAGALLSLAQQLGEKRGDQARAARGLAILDYAMKRQEEQRRARAQEQAFALQSAVAARAARTPTARTETKTSGAFDRMLMEAAQKKESQEQQLEQLTRMREQGVIDDAVFEQNKLRVMGDQAVSFPRPAAETTPPVGVRRAPYTEKVRTLREELDNILQWKYASNPEKSPWGSREGVTAAQQKIEQQIADITAQEQAAFGLTPPTPAKQPENKPPNPGQWDGQRAFNPETKETWVWRNGAWQKG